MSLMSVDQRGLLIDEKVAAVLIERLQVKRRRAFCHKANIAGACITRPGFAGMTGRYRG
jgi:hypothetical protein